MPRRAVSRTLALAALALMPLALGACASRKHETIPAISADLSDSSEWRPVGLSVDGRTIDACTRGQGPIRVLIVGGIHGDEREALPSIPRLAHFLDQEPAASAATWRLVRDLNPDGSVLMRRANARSVDLNRNFPARNFKARDRHGPRPLSEPETQALLALTRVDQPQLILVFHSSPSGPFVNYDGPAAGAAAAFARGAASVDPRWRLVPDMSYTTPGSMGSFYGQDLNIPILTIEFRRDQDPQEVWYALEAGFRALAEQLASGGRPEASEQPG